MSDRTLAGLVPEGAMPPLKRTKTIVTKRMKKAAVDAQETQERLESLEKAKRSLGFDTSTQLLDQRKEDTKSENRSNSGLIQEQMTAGQEQDAEGQPEGDAGDTPATQGGRIAFANKVEDDQAIPTGGLRCLMCQVDDTINYENKKVVYSESDFKQYIKGSAHRREQQLKRAFRIDMDVDDCADCPLCGKTIKGDDSFIEHRAAEHEEQLEY